jgi:hypothetical protein
MAKYYRAMEADIRQFQAMAARLGEFSKRDGRALMEEQARGVVRKLMDITPPSNGKTRGVKAKKLGEAAIASDVRNVFIGSTPKNSEVSSMSEMANIMHTKRRGGNIRIKRAVKQTRAARSMITNFIKVKQKGVGYLASGWASAARRLGKIRVPSWIGRHDAPGDADIKSTSTTITATISNMVKWASDVHLIDQRIQYAVRWQTRAMQNRVNNFLKKAAKKLS